MDDFWEVTARFLDVTADFQEVRGDLWTVTAGFRKGLEADQASRLGRVKPESRRYGNEKETVKAMIDG